MHTGSLRDSCPAPAAKCTLCDCMGWKQELRRQNEQNRDPVLLHSTPNCGHTSQKSVLFQTKIGFHTQLTLHQGSNTEMTFSSLISVLAEVRTGPWGLPVPLTLGFTLSEMHMVPERDVVCFISHLQLNLHLRLEGKAIPAKNRNDAPKLQHNTP